MIFRILILHFFYYKKNYNRIILQYSKAFSPIDLTDWGILISFNEKHFVNELLPIEIKDECESNKTWDNPVQL